MADSRIKKTDIVIVFKDVNGNIIGEKIYTWDDAVKKYPKQAKYYDLDSAQGGRDFRHSVRKKLNREHSPDYYRKLDAERKASKKAADPEGVTQQQAQYDANRAAQRKAEREAAAAARSALIASYTFKPLSDEDIHKIANKKAIDAISGQKQRALLYKIAPEPVPESYIPYRDYARLQRRGFNVPPILGTAYRGNFSPDSTSAMRKTVYDYVIAMSGVDEFGARYSGLTVPPNVEMQDVRSNRSQHNKVTQELLRRLGYHTDTSLMNLKGADSRVSPRGRLPRLAGRYALPAGVLGLAAGTTQASDLPWLAADFATGLDTRDFLKGWRENYDATQQAQGQETLSEGLSRAGQDWRELGEGILNIPERARNLYGRARSIFD